MFILKQLRRKKNINQIDLAKAINVSLRTIQLYEKKDANIPIKNLTKIAQYFEMSIAELYAKEGVNEVGAYYDERDIAYKKGHSINKLNPGKYLITVPLTVVKQQEKYLREYGNQLFIDTLPQMGFVIDQVSVGHYMAFEITNASMYDGTIESVPDKSIVLGKLIPVNKLSSILRSMPEGIWIIVHKDSIMCKKITAYDKKDKSITCHSLNSSPEYSDFEIKIDTIEQLFRVIKKQVD